MNYQQFITIVKNKVAQQLNEDISLQVHTALKNNSKERVGLTITDKRINISPTIYLEEYYKQFEDGMPISHIVDSIINVYHEVKFEHDWNIQTVKDFELMHPKIVYKLILANKNELLLQSMPFIAYLDFAIVFYILFEIDESGTATIPITHELMKIWNVSLDEIEQYAFQNAPQLLPAVFKPMKVVIDELLGTKFQHEDCAEELMYVLTNSLKSFGAACILYDGMLDEISKQLGENFYILPSSIHEMIIIPESNSPSRAHLDEMITDVNQTHVAEEELLAEHVYYYNRDTHQLN